MRGAKAPADHSGLERQVLGKVRNQDGRHPQHCTGALSPRARPGHGQPSQCKRSQRRHASCPAQGGTGAVPLWCHLRSQERILRPVRAALRPFCFSRLRARARQGGPLEAKPIQAMPIQTGTKPSQARTRTSKPGKARPSQALPPDHNSRGGVSVLWHCCNPGRTTASTGQHRHQSCSHRCQRRRVRSQRRQAKAKGIQCQARPGRGNPPGAKHDQGKRSTAKPNQPKPSPVAKSCKAECSSGSCLHEGRRSTSLVVSLP